MSLILRLPYELCVQVASNKRLSRHDLAAMRLVCRLFAATAASVLFRRVKMSRLKVDGDSFEHIAASKHLAQHVRELVWHELDLEAWIAPGEEAPRPGNFYASLDQDDFTLVQELMAGAAYDTSVFWFPRMSFEDHQNFALWSVGWFVTTLNKFPHLTAFVSCPMPQDRVITYKEYPIDPSLYRRQSRKNTQTSNCGFFSYMLVAMNRAESNVRALSWQDENIHPTNLGNILLPIHVSAFRALTTIYLCPTGFSQEQLDLMVICLKAAINLERLSLCYDRGGLKCPLISALAKSCACPSLISFEVSHINLFLNHMGSFLSKCTSLRHLHFRECRVLLGDVLKLRREMSPCQLTSITITSDATANLTFQESSLVDYVSRRSPLLLDSDGNLVQTLARNYRVCTESPNDDDSTSTFSDDEESTLQHLRDDWQKPYWSWGRFGPRGDMYYWQVEDADEAQAETTIWSFKDRSGRTRSGDPLEYLSDWDSEADNEATPLPYGEAYDKELYNPNPAFSGAEPPPGATYVWK
ncbi:hypothetical protein F4801DRAFT_312366 [Xylaria longipes]|nr:hypothetical protein F4801DRAFT_312366 [Xylaria longipes]